MGLGGGGKGKLVADNVVTTDQDVCPLCIEALDETERQFFPCRCGYQVCLFCYDRLKVECSNLCPGCRTPYDEDHAQVNAPVRRVVAVPKPANDSRVASSRQPTSGVDHGHDSTASLPRQPPPPPPVRTTSTASPTLSQLPPSQTLQRVPSHTGSVCQSDGPSASTTQVALNWATQPLAERAASQAEQQIMPDISEAWPSLADSTASSVATKHKPSTKHLSSPPVSRSQSVELLRTESRTSTGAAPPAALAPASNAVPIPSTAHFERQKEPSSSWETPMMYPAQHGTVDQRECNSNGASTSYRRPIAISIPKEVASHLGKPDPDGLELLHSIQQAIREHRLTPEDAAVHLVKYLRQREADTGKLSQRKQPLGPPPGFSAASSVQTEPASTSIRATPDSIPLPFNFPEPFPVEDVPQPPAVLFQEQLPSDLYTQSTWKAQSSFNVSDSIWSDSHLTSSLLPSQSIKLHEPVVPGHLHDLWRAEPQEQPEVLPQRPPGRVPLYARGTNSQPSEIRQSSFAAFPSQSTYGNGWSNGVNAPTLVAGNTAGPGNSLHMPSTSSFGYYPQRPRPGVSRLDGAYRPQLISGSRAQPLQPALQLLPGEDVSNKVNQLPLDQHWTALPDAWR